MDEKHMSCDNPVVMLLKLYAVLVVGAGVSFALSNALLNGPDPEGWWNFVPAIIFYGAVWLALVLPVALAVREVVWFLLSRYSRSASADH